MANLAPQSTPTLGANPLPTPRMSQALILELQETKLTLGLWFR